MPLTIDKLHESNDFLKFLFDNINSVILLVDDEFKVVTVNDAFSSLFHEGEQDIVNRLCGNAMDVSFVRMNRLIVAIQLIVLFVYYGNQFKRRLRVIDLFSSESSHMIIISRMFW